MKPNHALQRTLTASLSLQALGAFCRPFMHILKSKLCCLLVLGCLLSACATHEQPVPRVYEGFVILFRDGATFYPFESRSIKLGWEVVSHPPELTGPQGSMYYLRCVGTATPHGKPVRDGGPGAPMFQPHRFRVERVLEFRGTRPSDNHRNTSRST